MRAFSTGGLAALVGLSSPLLAAPACPALECDRMVEWPAVVKVSPSFAASPLEGYDGIVAPGQEYHLELLSTCDADFPTSPSMVWAVTGSSSYGEGRDFRLKIPSVSSSDFLITVAAYGGFTEPCLERYYTEITLKLLVEGKETPTPTPLPPTATPYPSRCPPSCLEGIISPKHQSQDNSLTLTIRHGGLPNSFGGLVNLTGTEHPTTKIDEYTYLAEDLAPASIYMWTFLRQNPCQEVVQCFSFFGTMSIPPATPSPVPTPSPAAAPTNTATPSPTASLHSSMWVLSGLLPGSSDFPGRIQRAMVFFGRSNRRESIAVAK